MKTWRHFAHVKIPGQNYDVLFTGEYDSLGILHPFEIEVRDICLEGAVVCAVSLVVKQNRETFIFRLSRQQRKNLNSSSDILLRNYQQLSLY